MVRTQALFTNLSVSWLNLPSPSLQGINKIQDIKFHELQMFPFFLFFRSFSILFARIVQYVRNMFNIVQYARVVTAVGDVVMWSCSHGCGSGIS